jgi:putative protease
MCKDESVKLNNNINTKIKKVELLAPGGNFLKIKIALAYGADAVYAGVSHFSLRGRSSKEFTYESYQEAVNYVHKKNKKIYATINGFPFNSQLELLKKHIIKMATIKPDGFIVASPSVISLCKQLAPNIKLHLSTQANVMNYLDAQFFYNVGVARIVVAREISLKDVIAIKKHIPKLEIEIFIHGSMCFAYSGRCLLSPLQTGRVSNRGSCANDCRMTYTQYVKNDETGTMLRVEQQNENEEGKGTHIFNAKDLNLSSHIKELLDSNSINTFKIEGRTKSPYYVAVSTYAYAMAIDDYYNGCFDAQKYQDELDSTKNRGFNDGYLVARPYNKNDTQNHDYSLSKGSYEVCGMVEEKYFMCKYRIRIGDEIEILYPKSQSVQMCDNEIGEIYQKNKSDKYYLKLKKIICKSGKELKSVHSGNLNPIKLPISLPNFAMLRIKM